MDGPLFTIPNNHTLPYGKEYLSSLDGLTLKLNKQQLKIYKVHWVIINLKAFGITFDVICRVQ